MRVIKNIGSNIILAVLLAAIVSVGGPGLPAQAVSGAEWQAGRIIDDSVFYNKSSMSLDQIQQFLNAKVPVCDIWGTKSYGGTTRRAYLESRGVKFPLVCLKDYQENPSTHQSNLNGEGVPAGAKSAAEIIRDAAQTYNINPQVLIVLLQKEQGLVTDDWPEPLQFRSATGYGCPDSQPVCQSEYYGFYNQINNAAAQFRRYANSPNSYNHVPFRNNSVRYNPQVSCGSSTVYIQNQATASLYNYTPYQPNQAALDNLYGRGDACSAHGNRNFWVYFNDWFGMSSGDGFALVKSDDPNDLRQWVVYGTIKQYIPDSQTIYAWGLQNVPLGTMSGATLGAISTGPNLDRLMRINGGSVLYFVDSGRRYRVPTNLFEAWNFSGVTISSVSGGLGNTPSDNGYLTTSVKDPGSSDIYLMDGGGGGSTVIRKFQNDNVRFAWNGDNAPYTTISADYWNNIKNSIGTPLTGTKISYGGAEYQSILGYRFEQPAAVAPLYPGAALPISAATFNRLAPAGPMSHMIRSASSPAVYMMDGGTRHHVLWPDLLAAWTTPATRIIIVNDAYVNLIASGDAVNSYFARANDSLFVIDRQKIAVPGGLSTAYGSITTPFNASSSLIEQFPTSGSPATGIVKGKNSPQTYVLDNSGKLRYLESSNKLYSWGGDSGVTVFSDYIIGSLSSASNLQVFVADGTSEYMLDMGKKYTVSAATKARWGLSNPQFFTDGTLNRLPAGGELTSDFKISNGSYFIVRNGASYGTNDVLIADAWGLLDPAKASYSPAILGSIPNHMLTRYVHSDQPGDDRVFLIDNGTWWNVPSKHYTNLGVANHPLMYLNPSNAPNAITDWNSVIVKNNQDMYFIIDGGRRRILPSGVIQSHWTNSGTLAIPVVTNGFINSFRVAGYVERVIKGSAPQVYSAENGTKRHILYPDTYNRFYAPFGAVSDALVDALPSGPSI